MTRSDPGSFQGVMLDITARKEAERKAEAAEDRFRTLTERGPVVAYTFDLVYEGLDGDPRLDITYLSPQAADLVHFPVEHWVEDPMVWFEMIHPDDRERVAENSRHNWRTDDPWSIRYRMIRSDGEVIWLLDTGGMVERDAEGRPWKFQGILFDVTVDEEARVRLETAEHDQREALEGALAIPWAETIHPDTGAERYTYIGPQALDILGYTPEELVVESTHFPRMVHPDDRARVRISAKRSAETGLWEETYRVFRRDGTIRWLHSFGRRSSPAGVVPEEWHGVTIDVTASHAHETAAAETRDDTRAERTSSASDHGTKGR